MSAEKKLYLLVYNNAVGSRDEVKDALNAMPLVVTWRTEMGNTFFILARATAYELSDEFRKLRPKGRYLFSEIGGNRQGWLSPDAWYLFKNKQLKPK